MRRTLAPLALLLAFPAVGHAVAAPDELPPLKASLTSCATGPTAAERHAVFTGSMPAQRGTARMAMRFDLLRRDEGSRRYARVKAAKLGRWERSEPGRAGFIWSKRVERLDDGASYRARIRFRWFDADGAVQRTAVRRTPVCVQPDQRADLEVGEVVFEDGSGYRVTVVNAGATAAAGSWLTLAVGRSATGRVAVPALAPGERATVAVAGGRCGPDRPVRVVADARDEVDEGDERDNRVLRSCDEASRVLGRAR